jgi:hypothetical protein
VRHLPRRGHEIGRACQRQHLPEVDEVHKAEVDQCAEDAYAAGQQQVDAFLAEAELFSDLEGAPPVAVEPVEPRRREPPEHLRQPSHNAKVGFTAGSGRA